jgi:hypothetical protein
VRGERFCVRGGARLRGRDPGGARYLSDGEAVLAHVVDERASRGYELALRGLPGRRGRGAQRSIFSTFIP